MLENLLRHVADQMRPGPRSTVVVCLAAAASTTGSAPAVAHTSERAFVLTLPTDFYVAGGAAVVGLSFLLVATIPAAGIAGIKAIPTAGWAAVWRLRPLPSALRTVSSLLSFALMAMLIGLGLYGTPDPLANPLPLTVWVLFWIGLTLAHAVFGNLWSVLNPWSGLYALCANVPGLRPWVEPPSLRYPIWLGYWPAMVQFLGFAWFELVYISPQDPEILARSVSVYFSLNLIAVLLFGPTSWLRHGEAFSVFFRIFSWLSPLNGRPENLESGKGRPASPNKLWVTLPGLGLLQVSPLPFSGVAFVVLALSSVSFDGLSSTFRWLAAIGVNPLDFPGRSAVTLPNSLGLLGSFALLLVCYLAAVWLGHRLAGRSSDLEQAFGSYVISIVPIAFGYHFAHYLTVFMVDVQYAAIAFSDPFRLGWDLFGVAAAHVTSSFLAEFHAVRLIWHCQVAVIVIAHVVAVAAAHLLALRQIGRRREAVLSQLPLTLLMIFYTLFGLWLLSTPVAG